MIAPAPSPKSVIDPAVSVSGALSATVPVAQFVPVPALQLTTLDAPPTKMEPGHVNRSAGEPATRTVRACIEVGRATEAVVVGTKCVVCARTSSRTLREGLGRRLGGSFCLILSSMKFEEDFGGVRW